MVVGFTVFRGNEAGRMARRKNPYLFPSAGTRFQHLLCAVTGFYVCIAPVTKNLARFSVFFEGKAVTFFIRVLPERWRRINGNDRLVNEQLARTLNAAKSNPIQKKLFD